MAQRLIELSCKRFRNEISDEDDQLIRNTSLDDVRGAVRQIETQLASRQDLRNLGRLTPFLNAIERYSKAIDALNNGVPFLPYIWAPVKFIIAAVYEHTQTLDKILTAYAQIGNSLPRLSRLGDSFPDNRDFQQLFAFLHEDIIEFHRKAYALVRKPAWKIFFSSAWGRFEHRFDDLIESITRVSAMIDREAVSLDIFNANEWRRKALDDSSVRERRWESEQAQAVMRWLETGDNDQELKLEWLKERCYPGTGSWITKNAKFRSWLQKGRGSPVIWLYGKPGAGKSVLASQIISFLRQKKDTRVLFFFCDYHSTPHAITAQVLRVFVAQIMVIIPEIIPYFYDEYLAKGRRPSASVLRGAIAEIIAESDDIRLVVDGIDELPASEHKNLISELTQLVNSSSPSCKLLISSQDLPSIRPLLSRKRSEKCTLLFLGNEKSAIDKDVDNIVGNSLEELNENFGAAIDPPLMEELRCKIRQKSEGMLLWVRLVLSLLESAANLADLRSSIDSLPKDLEAVYEKILNDIRNRCSPTSLARVRRIFGWIIFSRSGADIMKCELLIGTSLHRGLDSLSRDSRPFSNALEICKPLIEDGPRGTVVIIHSTLTQYLLSLPSGPFISGLTAQEDIAFACISQLIQVLDYVASGSLSQDLMTRTGLGVFGLQNYANENWIHHFLQMLTESPESSSETQNIVVVQAQRLCAKHSSILQSRKTSQTVHQDNPSTDLDLCLDRLDSMLEIQQLICQVLNFRKTLENQQKQNGLDVDALELDRTLFSRADVYYRRDVQYLSQIDSYQGLSQEELLAFHSDYGSTAFICPIRSCERFWLGYDSAVKLENHKTTRHRQALKCYWEGCTYNDVGYASLKSLREHQRRHHGKYELPQVPKSIRRAQENETNTRQQIVNKIHLHDSNRLTTPSPTTQSPSWHSLLSPIDESFLKAEKISHVTTAKISIPDTPRDIEDTPSPTTRSPSWHSLLSPIDESFLEAEKISLVTTAEIFIPRTLRDIENTPSDQCPASADHSKHAINPPDV